MTKTKLFLSLTRRPQFEFLHFEPHSLHPIWDYIKQLDISSGINQTILLPFSTGQSTSFIARIRSPGAISPHRIPTSAVLHGSFFLSSPLASLSPLLASSYVPSFLSLSFLSHPYHPYHGFTVLAPLLITTCLPFFNHYNFHPRAQAATVTKNLK
jgi:hypothetical protein